jgi:hypothetical protein
MELYTHPPIKAGQLRHLSLLRHPSKSWGMLYVGTIHGFDPALPPKLVFGLVENARPFLVTAKLPIKVTRHGPWRSPLIKEYD